MSRKMRCPLCRGDSWRVLYLGVPMWLCRNSQCSAVWGFWSWVATTLPIATETDEFAFFAYDGWYLPALWRWLWHWDV